MSQNTDYIVAATGESRLSFRDCVPSYIICL